MHTIFDVAKYILHHIGVGTITTMKLEKLCYYCQAWSLAWDEVPLFSEDFQAWANGPVCPELFEKHRGRFVLENTYFDAEGDIENFTEDEIATMNAVLDAYGNKEPQWLSELTHNEMPWIYARHGVPRGARCSNVITKESMQEYYGGL